MEYHSLALQKISSIDQFVEILYEGRFEEILNGSFEINIPKEEYEKYTFWKEKFYTRNCIARNENFELVLLCWEKGQKTSIHCHDKQDCWVKVVEGSFEEITFSFNDEKLSHVSSVSIFKEDETIVDDATPFHSLGNNNEGRSISLHLYMKPIEKCKVYNESDKSFSVKKLSYYSDRGVLV